VACGSNSLALPLPCWDTRSNNFPDPSTKEGAELFYVQAGRIGYPVYDMSLGHFYRMRGTWNTFQQGCLCFSTHVDAASGSGIGLRLNAARENIASRRADGPEQRIIQLYDALRPSLYRYLISSGLSPQDVEEVVQEAFLRLYRHMCSGGDEENLRAWIYQVAHNLSSNFRKSRRRLVDTTPELWEQLTQSTFDSAPGPEEQLLQQERLHRVHDGLAKLTQLQRDCLYLRVEGFRYREIGEMLNVGTSTVSGSLRNAINRLTKGCA
jgi:RNA polymerase sigma-70 factor (ECF subfamily)